MGNQRAEKMGLPLPICIPLPLTVSPFSRLLPSFITKGQQKVCANPGDEEVQKCLKSLNQLRKEPGENTA